MPQPIDEDAPATHIREPASDPPDQRQRLPVVSPLPSGLLAWWNRLGESGPEEEDPASVQADLAEITDEVARWVVARRLEAPAILFLETHRPLTTLAGHAFAFTSPLALPALGPVRTRRIGRLLETGSNIEHLIDRIEELSVRKDEVR